MKRIYLPAALLLLVANGLVFARLASRGVDFAKIRPTIQYYLTLQFETVLHGEPATIRTFLPQTGVHQTISSEKVEASHLSYNVVSDSLNRRAQWRGENIEGPEAALYEAIVRVHPKRYEIPDGIPIPTSYPAPVARYLAASESIQSESEEIRQAAREILNASGADDLDSTLRALFDFVLDEVEGSDYENTLDALTTLRWREAFCGGKSRLLTALLRSQNIPARMVGGLILTPGSKRTTHAWVEVWVNGTWIPFDALNGHYAEHPENYVELYHGDEILFSRTSDISFQYSFGIKRWRTAPDEALEAGGSGLFNSYRLWESFRQAHISLNLLRIILLLPVGVLCVVFFRNVVGLTTFGTFHPALIAVAFRDTGLLWGAILYLAVLFLGLGLRHGLDRLQLLHTPRLAILLLFVVAFMLAVSYGSVRMGVLEPAHVSLFPLAILTLTIESSFIKSLELGNMRTASIVIQTLFVIAVVYWVLDSYFLQAVVFAFPETLLAVAAASLVMGRWVGVRLTEYHRFRLLWGAS